MYSPKVFTLSVGKYTGDSLCFFLVIKAVETIYLLETLSLLTLNKIENIIVHVKRHEFPRENKTIRSVFAWKANITLLA